MSPALSWAVTVTVKGVPALSGFAAVAVTVVAAAADHYTVATSAANPFAGTSFNVTMTALDPYGNTASGFRGTVHFSSTDPRASLPADYTFTAADNGVHTFSGVVLLAAGNRSVTATDITTGTVTDFPLPTANSAPAGITAGPDGNLWFTEFGGNKVGVISPAGAVGEATLPSPTASPSGSRRTPPVTSPSPSPTAITTARSP